MELFAIYRCLADQQRLRILNLLQDNPLCVCHLQEMLALPQVQTSKHLAYLRRHGLVTARREGSWMVYALAEPPHPLILENLTFLRDCAIDHPCFRDDLDRRDAVLDQLARERLPCPPAMARVLEQRQAAAATRPATPPPVTIPWD